MSDFVFGSFLLYMLPGLIAILRRHHNALAITVLTVVLGWTGFGWLVALVWAFTAKRSPAQARIAP